MELIQEAMAALGSGEVLALVIGVLAGSLVAGVLAGFFGVGGGIIIVPMLFHVFGFVGVDESIRMHQAVATSLATIVLTSLRSISRHARHDAVDGAILRRWAIPAVLGVAAGALLADFVAGRVLTLVFVGMAFVVSANLAFGRDEWRLGDAMPGEPWRAIQGVSLGFLSSLAGVGGGVLGISLMTLYGVAIHRAVGTASGLGLIIGLPGALGFILAGWDVPGRADFSLGYVNLLAFALIVPMTTLAVPLGVHVAHRLSRTVLRRAFASFLTVLALSMLADLWFAR